MLCGILATDPNKVPMHGKLSSKNMTTIFVNFTFPQELYCTHWGGMILKPTLVLCAAIYLKGKNYLKQLLIIPAVNTWKDFFSLGRASRVRISVRGLTSGRSEGRHIALWILYKESSNHFAIQWDVRVRTSTVNEEEEKIFYIMYIILYNKYYIQLSLRCGPGQTCWLACLCSAWSASVHQDPQESE